MHFNTNEIELPKLLITFAQILGGLMKILYFLEGKQGLTALMTLTPYTKQALVVLTEDKGDKEIKEFCQENNIGVLLRSEIEPVNIPQEDYDYLLNVNFPYPIDEYEMENVKGEILNLHPALLPKYGGKDAFKWAIINGEREMGATLHVLDPDTFYGEIIAQEKYIVRDGDWMDEVERQQERAIDLLLEKWAEKQIMKTEIDNSDVHVWRNRLPLDDFINWKLPARYIYNLVKANSNEHYKAYTFFQQEKIIIKQVRLTELRSNEKPGTVVVEGSSTYVVAGDQFLIKLVEFDTDILDLKPGTILH